MMKKRIVLVNTKRKYFEPEAAKVKTLRNLHPKFQLLRLEKEIHPLSERLASFGTMGA